MARVLVSYVGYNDPYGKPDPKTGELTTLPQVRSWLQAAVSELGVGAKTRAGYGELQEPSATSSAGQPSFATAAATTDPTSQLEAAISSWTEKRMGDLQQLVEQIARIADAARRQQLAQQLQQKLMQAKRWGRYKSSSWHQARERLLGGASGETS